jgi:hypothetical protein
MNARINAINQMYVVVAHAEIRVAKELQEFWPDWTWTKCLKEAHILVGRHGINITIVKE